MKQSKLLITIVCLLGAPAASQELVVFDTDSGFFNDDGAALVMIARSPERVAIQGVTVVSGNVWARQGAEYMFHNLRLLGRDDLPVYLGAQEPLVHSAPMSRREGKLAFSGAFGLDGTQLKPPQGGRFIGRRPAPRNAIDFLADTVEQNPGRVTLLALGPLTNVAVALRLRPDIARKIGRLVFMGGAFGVPGNVTGAAEFNFWFDPEAAQIVLRSRIPKKIMIALDLTNQAVIRKEHFEQIVAVKTPITDLYREDSGNRYPGFLKNPKATGYLWDELAAAYLLDPAIARRLDAKHLDVDTRFGPTYGKVIPLDRALAPEATPVEVALDLDFPRAFGLYKQLMTRRATR